MSASTVLIVLLVLTALAYIAGRQRAIAGAGKAPARTYHSLPGYYGGYVGLWCLLPTLVLFAIWLAVEPIVLRAAVIDALPPAMQALPEAELGLLYNDVRNLVEGNFVFREPAPEVYVAAERYAEVRATSRYLLAGTLLVVGLAAVTFAYRRVRPDLRARNQVEKAVEYLLIGASLVAILTTIGIFLSVLFEALRFFQQVSPIDFLFGLTWSPQTAIREDQVGSSGAFGAIPLFTGTLLISGIAMLVAAPVGLMSAIYLSEYANPRVRNYAKPLLELLAGIPTVVYGYFAALWVGPTLRRVGEAIGLDVASESAQGAGLVMGLIIIPLV